MGRFSRLGNDLYEGRVSIDFMGRKWLWYLLSGVIIVLAVVGLSTRGLNLGVEFKGGIEYTVTLPTSQVNQASVDKISDAVTGTGIENADAPIVTTSGERSILVQTETLSSDQSDQVTSAIRSAVSASEVSANEVGPSLGAQVADRALTGLIVFLVLVVLFIWAYFRQWKMSVAAIVALGHDLVITVGVYALSGFEVTPATVTGVLTILGFSLYDTVVVFDKVRENTKNLRRSRRTYSELANLAVNQTLVRSINTSFVALLPVAALLYVGVFQLGSGALKDLALALFVGMAAGTYSSIFIATPLLVQLKAGEREITDQDSRARARARRDVDRYAGVVPVYSEGMRVDEDAPELADLDDDSFDDADDDPSSSPREGRAAFAAPPRRRGASGSGRTAPAARGPVAPSASAKRNQPTRRSRSKRQR